MVAKKNSTKTAKKVSFKKNPSSSKPRLNAPKVASKTKKANDGGSGIIGAMQNEISSLKANFNLLESKFAQQEDEISRLHNSSIDQHRQSDYIVKILSIIYKTLPNLKGLMPAPPTYERELSSQKATTYEKLSLYNSLPIDKFTSKDTFALRRVKR